MAALRTEVQADLAADGQTFVGEVKSYNPLKGWGHIECEDTFRIFGKDVFLLRSQVHGGDVAKGVEVAFTVANGARGPEATGVTPIAKTAGRHVGVMKSWNPTRGWGHIECEETHEHYGKDIFVMRSSLIGGQVEKGRTVAFSVVEGLKGPEAASVQILDDSVPAPTAIAPKVSIPVSRTRFFVGWVREYSKERGVGFVVSDEAQGAYGAEICLTRSQLGGYVPTVGDELRFSVAVAEDGRLEAVDISVQCRYQGRSRPY